MTLPAPVTRYSCPLPDCGWEHDVTPADGPLAVEMVLRLHVDDHSVLEYVRALQAAQRGREDQARTGDLVEGDSPAAEELARHMADQRMSVLQGAFRILGMRLTTEVVEAPVSLPPGDLYVCPAALEVESKTHGGFGVCCDRPDLHVPLPDGPATDALSEALGEARKREHALTAELDRWRPSHAVTHHTYEGPGPCRADLFGQTCDQPRDDHELICEGD